MSLCKDGVLNIAGTGGHDEMRILRARPNVRAAVDGRVVLFKAAQVTAIQIKGLGGNDWIGVGPSPPRPSSSAARATTSWSAAPPSAT